MVIWQRAGAEPRSVYALTKMVLRKALARPSGGRDLTHHLQYAVGLQRCRKARVVWLEHVVIGRQVGRLIGVADVPRLRARKLQLIRRSLQRVLVVEHARSGRANQHHAPVAGRLQRIDQAHKRAHRRQQPGVRHSRCQIRLELTA